MNKINFFAKRLLILAVLPFNLAIPNMPEMPKAPDAVALNYQTTRGYIVLLKDNMDNTEAASIQMSDKFNFSTEQVYSHALNGFAARMPDQTAKELSREPGVEAVIEDRPVQAFAQTLPTGIDRIDAETNMNKGSGIAVAVIDTGIHLSHPDLSGAIVANKSCVFGKFNGNDDNGHGTHVAGIVAAKNNNIGIVGVAPQTSLVAVKVLDRWGNGSWSSIICGLDWVTANASRYNIKVANLSLGGGGTSDNNCGYSNIDPLHRAICRARDAGITIVVAAGNSDASTTTTVPAAYDDAVITVSALADSDGKPGGNGPGLSYGSDDTFATFSNFGPEVDIAAPGVNIYSTYKNGGYTYMSGTSMASPHVAGAAALYIKSHTGSSWIQVKTALINASEPLGQGHSDPSGNKKHPERVLKANGL